MIQGLFFILLLVTPGLTQNTGARLDQVVQADMANNPFMGSVLVARGDNVLLNKGYGSADLEWNLPNEPSTKFRLGSLSKQFTAAAILLLEQRGKLKTDDLVKKYLPEAPPAWDKMTIFNVLTHTAGIPNFTSFPDYASKEPFPATPKELVARFLNRPLDFPPGEKWSYSNSGYVLLGYLIERITGQSYQSFVQENIFNPLGMTDSGYDSNAKIIPRRASGYAPGSNGLVNAGYINMTVPFSAGGLYSTTGDLLRWEQGLFSGKLLSAPSLQKMTTPFKNDYAFGLEVHTVGGHKVIEHNGGIEGFSTVMAYYPENKLTVIVLGNVSNTTPERIATDLASAADGKTVTLESERKAITLDANTLRRYVGAYQLSPAVTMLITLHGDQLVSQMTGQAPVPIFPESETTFFSNGIDATLTFSGTDAQQRSTQMTLHQGGRELPARRLNDAEFEELGNAAAATAKRVKDQIPLPGSAAALRKKIEGLQLGKPEYSSMTANMAAVTAQQLTGLQSMLKNLGAVQAITFSRVLPNGADVYEVKFANGTLNCRIALGSDGKIETFGREQ